MGATRDFVAATMADALLPAFRRPVEDIIYETLDRRQVPTRTDFKEMRDLLNNLRGQVTGSAGGVKKLADRAEEVDGLLEELEARIGFAQNRQEETEAKLETALGAIAALAARLDRLEGGLSGAVTADQLEERLQSLPAAVTAKLDECKVPGCGETARARGFCAKHYQKWRRNTLAGYVGPEGEVQLGKQNRRVDASLSGEPYAVDNSRVIISGQAIPLL